MGYLGLLIAGGGSGVIATLAGFSPFSWQFYAICAPIWIGAAMARNFD